ncbi:MAG TPA: response regulator [Gemmatimonadales bacterium]|nr:response regulator [Gemmatimonadales bacterium]
MTDASAAAPRVLVVDDDLTITRLVLHVVRARGFGPARHVTTGREALEALDGVDIVLLDHQLPDANGLDLLETIRARANPPTVIVITAHGNETLAAAALRLGADDYLAKDQSLLELLPQVLERARRNRELRKALAAAERDLVRAERLTAIGEMTVTLHHSINNPLMAASADLELLLTDSEMPVSQRQQTLRDIQAALHRIRDIVRQIGALRDVRSKSYLPGMRMVDLDAPAADGTNAPAATRGGALLFVSDEDLARVVGLLLRHAGFAVQRCGTLEQLRLAAGRPDVALVLVVGGTDAAGAHPLAGFDPPVDRIFRVVALVAGDGAAARAAGADRVVRLPFDPGTFTTDMVELTH